MDGLRTFFFDSYAFFAILDKNENYRDYTKGVAIVTTKLNLMEVHYGLLQRLGKENADSFYDKLVGLTVDITDDMIKKANEFKSSVKNRKLSYIDCIGYIAAKLKGIKFLTGDKQFEDMENVEYVK